MIEPVVRHDRDHGNVVVVEHQLREGDHLAKEAFGREARVGRLADVVPLTIGHHGIVFGMGFALLGMLGQVTLAVVQDGVLVVGSDAQILERVLDFVCRNHGTADAANFPIRGDGAIDFW